MLRLTFSSIFVLLLFYNMFSTDRQDVITEKQCIVDKTFIWTDHVNAWLMNHLDTKNAYIIYCSLLMDLMVFTYLGFFILYFKSLRVIISYVMFFAMRCFVQVSYSFNLFTAVENLLHG